MALNIGDGKGRGFEASVSESQRLNISSKSAERTFYVSRDDGQSFIVVSVDAGAAAGDFVCYIKNISSTRKMFIGEVHVSADNAALWKLWTVTGTAVGSNAIVATNLNRGSGIVAETTSRGDGAITGIATEALVHTARHGVDGYETMSLEGAFSLNPNDALAIEYDIGTSGAAEVNVEFHFEGIGRKN